MSEIYRITDGDPSRDTWTASKERAIRKARSRSAEEPKAVIRVAECEIDDLSHLNAICAALNGTLITRAEEIAAFRNKREIAWT